MHLPCPLYRHLILALLAAAFFYPETAAAEDATPRPNIVVILADDLGIGDLGCFGQKVLKTPALDAMAAEGIRFTQFYTGGAEDSMSRCVMLTGRHSGRAALRGGAGKGAIIPPGDQTAASLLKTAGYATACIGKWGIGAPDKLTAPNEAGFDHFFGQLNSSTPLVRDGKVVQPAGETTNPPAKADHAPTLLLEDALSFVRAHQKTPFFLYLALNSPRATQARDLGEFANAEWPEPEKAFAAAVRDVDQSAARIVALLKELAIEKNTLVIFTSDAGPHEEGGHKADFFDSNGVYRGISGDVTEGGIRVPMIAWWPGVIAPGSENDRQWYLGDLISTAAELAGVKPPEGLDSDSLVTALRTPPTGDKWKRKGRLYWESLTGETEQTLRFGKWKAMRSPILTGTVRLYDMSHDYGEKRDHTSRPDLTNHATNLLNASRQPDADVQPAKPSEKAEAAPR
jgi:arylsulfatase A-like enzyme